MQTIDIITTQNVTIQYALASVRDRILSFFVDAIVLGVCLMLMTLAFSSILGAGYDYAVYLLIVPFFTFYSLGQEIILNGQTIGKRLMSLKIVKVNGKEPTLSDYLIRWAFRFIDIWFSFGSIAVMLISSTDRQQRLGDLLANTAVIKLNPWSNVNLNEILSIHSIDTYKPTYPEVKKYSEQDMLLVKQTLDRIKSFDNAAHREALVMLADRMADQLGLASTPADKPLFLKTLLNDYVVIEQVSR
jgi:uncharacterized RDD family membrane protein YckC